MFSFASKMLNTLIGTEEEQQQQQQGMFGGPGGPQMAPQQHMGPQQQQMRMMGPGGPQRPQGMPMMGGPRGPPRPMGQRPMGQMGPMGPRGPQMGPPRMNGPPPQQGQRMMGPRPPMGRGGPMGPMTPSHFADPMMQQQQQMQRPPQMQMQQQQPVAAIKEDVPSVDLSHLSAEERAMIESVMAKAQQEMDKPPEPPPAAPSQIGHNQNQRINQNQEEQQRLQLERQHNEITQQIKKDMEFREAHLSRSPYQQQPPQHRQGVDEPALSSATSSSATTTVTTTTARGGGAPEDRLEQREYQCQASSSTSTPDPLSSFAAAAATLQQTEVKSNSVFKPTLWKPSVSPPPTPPSPTKTPKYTFASTNNKPSIFETEDDLLSKFEDPVKYNSWRASKLIEETKSLLNSQQEERQALQAKVTTSVTPSPATDSCSAAEQCKVAKSPPVQEAPSSLPILDHSPGEVYTIPEEEEEETSSPIGSDGVTSLRRRGDASMGLTRSNYMDITGRPASSRDESFVSDTTGLLSGSPYRLGQSGSPKSMMEFGLGGSRLRGMQKESSIDIGSSKGSDGITNPLLNDPLKGLKSNFLNRNQQHQQEQQETIQNQLQLLQDKHQQQQDAMILNQHQQDILTMSAALTSSLAQQQQQINSQFGGSPLQSTQPTTMGSTLHQQQNSMQMSNSQMQNQQQMQNNQMQNSAMGLQSGLQSGMQQGGLQQQQTGLQNSLTSGMQNSLTGGLQSNLTGGLQNSMTGGLQSNLTGGLQNNLTGGLQNSMTGGLQNSLTSGLQNSLSSGLQSLQNSMQSGLQNNMQSGLQSGMQSGLQSGLQSNLQSGMQSSLQNNMQSGLQSGLQNNLQSGFQNNLQSGLQTGLQNSSYQQNNMQNSGLQNSMQGMQSAGLQGSDMQYNQQQGMLPQNNLYQQTDQYGQQSNQQAVMQQPFQQQNNMELGLQNQYQQQQQQQQNMMMGQQQMGNNYNQQQQSNSYQQQPMMGQNMQQYQQNKRGLKLMDFRDDANKHQHLQQQQQQQQQQNADGKGTGTISGMLADFSRALGLGSTSPRPSPSEDKSMMLGQYGGQFGGQIGVQQQQQMPQMSQAYSVVSQPQVSYGQTSSAVSQLLSSQPTSSAYAGLPVAVLQGGNPQTALVLTSCQHLTPQQQQMYQQQMQLQHQAQHLKKIRRNLPQSETSQLQQMRAKVMGRKDVLTSMSQPVMSSTMAGVTSSILHSDPFALGTRGSRDAGDSSDTLSETDSQKSLRLRRKLPPTPLDPLESARLNSTKKRERSKSQPIQDRFRSYSPLRHSLDRSSGFNPGMSGMGRPSASETNLRSLTMGQELDNRPGSALGLLGVSSVVSSSGLRSGGLGSADLTTTTSAMPSLYSSARTSSSLADIASVLPPNLRHLLGPSAGSYAPDASKYTSKQLPTYLQSLKEQLREEIKSATADRRRYLSEKEARLRWEREKFVASMDPLKRFEMEKKLSSPMLSSSVRNKIMRGGLIGQRRQLSDPKIYPMYSSISKDGDLESKYERDYLGGLSASLRPSAYRSSYELESLEEPLRQWGDPSQSYLATSYAAAGGALRETAINSVLDEDDLWNQYLTNSRDWNELFRSELETRYQSKGPTYRRGLHPSKYYKVSSFH